MTNRRRCHLRHHLSRSRNRHQKKRNQKKNLTSNPNRYPLFRLRFPPLLQRHDTAYISPVHRDTFLRHNDSMIIHALRSNLDQNYDTSGRCLTEFYWSYLACLPYRHHNIYFTCSTKHPGDQRHVSTIYTIAYYCFIFVLLRLAGKEKLISDGLGGNGT